MRKKEERARKIKIFFIFGASLILAMIFIFSTVGKKEFSTPHKFVLELLGSMQYGTTRVAHFFTGYWHGYVALWDVRKENLALQEEMQKVKVLNNEYREAAATNIRLTKLLKLKESLPALSIAAEIVGKDPSIWFKTVIVNRGTSDGVQKGMPVVTAEGVVGQVINTSPNYAKVLLAIDSNSAIDVVIQKNRVQGIIKGNGEGYNLEYVLKNSEVQEGDRIVTSGLDGVFSKGLPVGKVISVTKNRLGMFQKIKIAPEVDFSRLENIIIILKENSLAE